MPEVTLASFDRAEWLRGWAHDLNQRLNALADGTRTYRVELRAAGDSQAARVIDRKSTRLNSSHLVISYAVFCLKKKKKTYVRRPFCTQAPISGHLIRGVAQSKLEHSIPPPAPLQWLFNRRCSSTSLMVLSHRGA